MITSSDILRYNNDLWLSQDYILDNAGVDYDYLRVAKSRANRGAQSWKHQTIQNRCYFAYATLPKPTTVRLPDASILSGKATEVQNDVANIASKAIYSTFKLFLNQMTEAEARSAALIHEASIYIHNNSIAFSKSPFFQALSKEVEVQGFKYLPTTWRNLRDKIKAYANGEEITTLVYAKNKGNSNSSIYSDNEQLQNWLIDLGESGKNFSGATITRKLSLICEQHGIKSPSPRWVSDWLSKPETQFLISKRYGSSSRFNNRYRIYTPTASALYAGDCWEIDGTRVNIIDHKATTYKDGLRKSSNEFLYIVAVRDVMSGHILGWEYCYEESADVIINALAMAVRNAGYLPYEFRYDKFPGHNTQDWMWIENELRKQGVIMTQTIKAEGKAHIERWWGTLQNVFMSESDLYYGEGIRSTRKYAHRSKEYVQKVRQLAHKRGFDFDAASRETDKILTAYMTTPFSAYSRKYKNINKSPFDLHSECTHPNAINISHPIFCYLFGLKKDVSIRNYMIQTQIDGATYYYGVDDVEVAEKYTGIKLLNCFDPENLDNVYVFDFDKYLGTYTRITPAQQYGPNKDMRAVGKVKAIGEKMKKARENKLEESLTSCTFDNTPASEMGVILNGKAKKHDAERAESRFIQNEWEDEGAELIVNVRSHY